MHLRRTLALLTGAIAVLTLTSCGFDYATDRVYTPANGVNDREAGVDVLGAVVVSSQPGSGTFIASFANNDVDEPATVTGIEPTEAGAVEIGDFEPVEIPANGLVNLADEGGPQVTGDFEPGQFVGLRVLFDNGEQADLDVLVVTNCGDYEGLDGPPVAGQCEAPEPAAGH